VSSDWETGNAVATLIQYPFTPSRSGWSGNTLHLVARSLWFFSIHRGRQPTGECNGDAIPKQLKTAN
jgi:hypothetical protein